MGLFYITTLGAPTDPDPKPSDPFHQPLDLVSHSLLPSMPPAWLPLPGQALHTSLELSLQAKFLGCRPGGDSQAQGRVRRAVLWDAGLGIAGEQLSPSPIKVLLCPRKALLTEICCHPHSVPSIAFSRKPLCPASLGWADT